MVVGRRTKYRRICWTWILTVLKDSLSSFPSSTTGGAAAGVAIVAVDEKKVFGDEGFGALRLRTVLRRSTYASTDA